MHRLARARDALPLAAIVLLGIGLRLLYISSPLLDAHRWRQIDTAVMARYFYEDSLNPLYPQVNWGGAHGYVESEFPLVPFIAALLYFVFGPDDRLGRLTSVGFSAGLIVLVYLLVQAMRGRSAGRAAAFLVAVSPGAVYYGRTFMPDTAMLCLSVGALFAMVRYLESGSTSALRWGSAALSAAILVKLPAILVLLPIAAAAWQTRGRAGLFDRRLWVALIVPLAVATAWYVHAYFIYRESGLTYGILAHPARTYPPSIAPGPWPDVFSKWSTMARLLDAELYRELLERITRLLLTPIGLAVALLGMLTWRGKWSLVPAAWLAAMTAFILIAAEGNIAHDYYQLPLVVIGAMYFGVVAAPLFDGAWIREHVGGWWGTIAVPTLVTALAFLMFSESGVVRTHFRGSHLDTRMLVAGQAIDRAAADRHALFVVVDDYGVTSPVLLYLADRRGWSFGPGDLRPATIEWLRTLGAGYFAATRWSDLSRRNPELANYLERYPRVPLSGEPPDTVLIDLRRL
jgi:4-amino-4-deoxy-L-arabinose transferase-like glycosyltransferase